METLCTLCKRRWPRTAHCLWDRALGIQRNGTGHDAGASLKRDAHGTKVAGFNPKQHGSMILEGSPQDVSVQEHDDAGTCMCLPENESGIVNMRHAHERDGPASTRDKEDTTTVTP